MIDTELPPGPGADEVTRGFAACLASVTEVAVADLPLPPTLATALGAWRTWLAERGFGLVPIADPVGFQWAGWWIAVVEDTGDPPAAVLAFGTPPGVVLSPQAPALLGRATATLAIVEAHAVASLDPVIGAPPPARELSGTVEGLAVAGTALDFAGSRRNVLTRGIDLAALIGRTFLIGEVLCEGRRLCEPCAHLERLAGPGTLRPLIHQGGLRVDVLGDGEIARGAPIRTV